MHRRATLGGVAAHLTLLPKLHPFSPRRSKNCRFAWAIIAALSLLACADGGSLTVPHVDDAPAPTDPPPPNPSLADAELQLVSGDDQEGEVAHPLPEAVTVQVTDTLGQPIAGAPVEWLFTQGGGRGAGSTGPTTASVTVHTDGNGLASVEWELGTTAGAQTADAGIVIPEDAVQTDGPSGAPKQGWGKWRPLHASARAGSVNSVSVTPSQIDALVGDSAQLSATVADRYGNTIETATVEWTSTDESVVRTEPSGVIHLVAEGSASVLATSGSKQAAVTVTAEAVSTPLPPVGDILSPSSDTTIVVGESVRFLGSATDPDGTVTGHAWNFGDGATSTRADPGTHAYVGEGTFDVTYIVSDDTGLESAPATRSIAVVAATNQLPIVTIDAPTTGSSVLVGESVEFLGTATDPDGSISRHRWTFGDGSSSSVEDPGARSYAAPGTYVVTYRAWDDADARSQLAQVSVTVEAANQPPAATIASPSSNPTIEVGEDIVFQGSASDPDGAVARHAWTFGDGSTSSAQNPGARSYSAPGTYTVTYRVWDDEDAASNTAQRVVTVEEVATNQPPTATIASPSSNLTLVLGATVDFRGTASDSDGTIASHTWSFGDGSGSDREDPGVHTYLSTGTFTVTYRVTDDGGASSATSSRIITVIESTPPPPPPYVPNEVYFSTDWSTATGTSTNAILDGGRWSQGSGNWLNSFSVQSRGSLAFPTDNVLVQRGIAESGSWGQIELLAGAVPLLQVGDSLGMRVYWQSPNPYGNVDDLLHGFEVLDPGNDPIGINSRYSSGGWQIEIDIPTGEVYGPRGSSGMGAFDLTPNGVYMLEVLVVRVASSQMHVETRLTNAATGNVIMDVDDWTSYYDPNALAMHQGTPFATSSASWSNLREWRMGINGIGNVDGQVVHRWGGFALCSSWCGPYPIPGVEGN